MNKKDKERKRLFQTAKTMTKKELAKRNTKTIEEYPVDHPDRVKYLGGTNVKENI